MKQPSKPNDAWTDYDPPLVTEDGSVVFRYRVESKSDPKGYHLCDLTDRNGHGACDCIDFQTRANPNFKRHGKFIPFAPGREGRTECRHLRAAFEHFHQHVTISMLATFSNGIPSPS